MLALQLTFNFNDMNLNLLFHALSEDEKDKILEIARIWKRGLDGTKPVHTQLTSLRHFYENSKELTPRLKTLLRFWVDDTPYLETLTKQRVLNCRGIGKKTWEDFCFAKEEYYKEFPLY